MGAGWCLEYFASCRHCVVCEEQIETFQMQVTLLVLRVQFTGRHQQNNSKLRIVHTFLFAESGALSDHFFCERLAQGGEAEHLSTFGQVVHSPASGTPSNTEVVVRDFL